MADTTGSGEGNQNTASKNANILQPQSEQSRGFVSDIVLNALEPGVNASVLVFLNVIFVLLLATLVGLSFATGFNVHILLFGVLTVGLMVGFNV